MRSTNLKSQIRSGETSLFARTGWNYKMSVKLGYVCAELPIDKAWQMFSNFNVFLEKWHNTNL